MSLSRQNKRIGKRALLFATLALVLILATDLITGGSVRSLVRGSTSPISGASTRITSGGFFSSRGALQAENEKLRDEVAKLTLHAALLQSLERENDELRALVALSEDFSGVGARVTSSYKASPYGTFHIDAGSNAGISPGHLVLAGDGSRAFILGHVSEVSASSALVVQVFAPGASIEALAGETPLALEGQGGGNGRAEISRALDITEGQIVEAPSLRGLPIGVVGRVEEDAASATKAVYVGLPVNLSALRFVYVVPR